MKAVAARYRQMVSACASSRYRPTSLRESGRGDEASLFLNFHRIQVIAAEKSPLTID